MDNTRYFDGKHLKGFNIPFSLDSDLGWDIYGKEIEGAELYYRVAAVYRALNLTANALSSLPFAVVSGKTDYDTSDDWQNKVGFLPNPKDLIRKWRKSISMTNAAYGFLNKKEPLRYLVPSTITPKADKDGLKGFERRIDGTGMQYYPLDNKCPIIHLFYLDYDTELLPTENTEFKAMMASAGILAYSDYFVEDFFKRGGIKPHLLKVAGVPLEDERKKISEKFADFMRGLFPGWVVNADTMEPQAVGSGVDDFKDNQFYRQAIENIAMVTGIPLSMLLSNSANYATARAEIKTWFDTSVVPFSEWMEGELNANLFSRFGLRFEFRPEMSDPDQEEEKQKAVSWQIYSGQLKRSGHPKANSLAARIVGIDMPTGTDYDDLDERDESLIQQPPQFGGEQEKKPPQPKDDEQEDDEGEEMEEAKSFTPNSDQLKELGIWQDIATRKIGKGQELVLPFENKSLPDDIAKVINDRLETVTDLAGVKRAFDLSTITPAPQYSEGELKYLADAINKLAETKTQTVTPNENHFYMPPITVNTPEQSITVTPEVKADAPTVTVNVPEQPAPVVNVTNQVQTPKVEVKNDVKPAPVLMKAPKKAKVKRDGNGNIESIEAQ